MTNYIITGADQETILATVSSYRQAMATARRILGVRRLVKGHSGWVHASHAYGCASVWITRD